MKEVGYEVEEGGKDEELVKRCETLLLKKTLGRPPVTLPLKGTSVLCSVISFRNAS